MLWIIKDSLVGFYVGFYENGKLKQKLLLCTFNKWIFNLIPLFWNETLEATFIGAVILMLFVAMNWLSGVFNRFLNVDT